MSIKLDRFIEPEVTEIEDEDANSTKETVETQQKERRPYIVANKSADA
jgi:hypothetical protein